MSHRPRRHRKRFACGHRGFGQYCHCCSVGHRPVTKDHRQQWQAQKQLHKQRQHQAKALKRQQWRSTFADDPIDLKFLPPHVTLKARQVLEALEQGTGYWEVAGKRLKGMRQVIRIPVTRRYRLLCHDNGRSLQPLQVMSHEDYNAIARYPRRYYSKSGSIPRSRRRWAS